MLVTAFGADPAGGKGTLLRLWEQAGETAPVQVQLPAGMKVKTAQPVNLRGEKMGKPIAVSNGRLNISMTAWSPMSFILQ